jgi:hypothetical protein
MKLLTQVLIAATLLSSWTQAFAGAPLAPRVHTTTQRPTVTPLLGGLMGVTPRIDSGYCPAFARFRLLTVESGVQYSVIAATTKWEKDHSAVGRPICKAVISPDQFAGLPRPGLRVFASVQTNQHSWNRSTPIVIHTVCTDETCVLVPLVESQAESSHSLTADLKVDGCDRATQTCTRGRGTVGESLQTMYESH